ncbi:MAG: DUF3795 domain-containing protein [Syntrophales bacterium]
MYNKELISPCGLYCGVCGIHKAGVDNDEPLKEKLAKLYGVDSPAKIQCAGCRSEEPFFFCRVCAIKSCAEEKNLEGCHQCESFPCEKIQGFPFAEAKENMLRAVPRWRELGTEAWVKEEEERFRCKSCGTDSFRGARKCRQCGTLFVF